MADVTRLIAALDRYAKQLNRHSVQTQQNFEQLQQSYERLRGRFEGRAATDFGTHWSRTISGLNAYNQGVASIRRILEERLDALRQVDRTDGL